MICYMAAARVCLYTMNDFMTESLQMEYDQHENLFGRRSRTSVAQLFIKGEQRQHMDLFSHL